MSHAPGHEAPAHPQETAETSLSSAEGRVAEIEAAEPPLAEELEPAPRSSPLLELGLVVGVFAVLMALWVYVASAVSPIVFPPPGRVWEQLADVTASGLIINNLLVTVAEILLGFLLGSVLGIGLGALLSRSPLAQRIASPYLIASQAMPKLALAPMLVLWFGFGITSKVVIAALIAFFPLLENTVVGLREVPRDEQRLFQSLSATQWQTFVKLQVPNALPYIFAGLRVAMLFATVGAVVGEYVGANVGLGAMIIVAYGTLNTAMMFAVMIVLTVVGIVLYKAVEYAERWVRTRVPD